MSGPVKGHSSCPERHDGGLAEDGRDKVVNGLGGDSGENFWLPPHSLLISSIFQRHEIYCDPTDVEVTQSLVL